MHINAPRTLSLILLIGLLLSACSPAASPAPTAMPTTPASTPTPAPLATVKVVTYNILFGGGRDRALDSHIEEKWRDIDRTLMIREYLKQLDADIVGLQEASGWDSENPPYIASVAEELGMNYVALPAWWGLDAALLTRYDVLDYENLSDEVNSALRAKLQGPDGEPINVFVAHLNSDSMNDRACGTQLLLRKMQPYINQRTFLMGDMNFNAGSGEWGPAALKEAGWKLVARDNRWGFDQVWVPSSMNWEATAWSPLTDATLAKMSDHSPSGLELSIYSRSGEMLPDTVTPTPMPALTSLPEAVAPLITNARVGYVDDPDAPCHEQRWSFDALGASLTRNNLHLYGKQDWQAAAGWSKHVFEGEAMLLDFQYAAKSEFNIFLEHADWATPEYRRFGLYVPASGGPFEADLWKGDQPVGGEPWTGIGQAQPGTWYRLVLLAAKGGRLRGYLWPVDDPSQVATYSLDAEGDWAGLPWKLMVGANRGSVDLRSVQWIVFDEAE
jgi:endonuclease/exonuclease/phosphatase family metal-dependent hydrolase